MPRLFTLQQAQRLLPEVEAALREAIDLQAEYQDAEEDWRKVTHHITLQGGVMVDHTQLIEKKNRRESTAQAFKSSLETIHELGCLVKDLDTGLVDFPTLFRGTEVYLCWKLGEAGIHFWHGVDEGFRGRKPIDQDFLDHHQGERTN